MIEREIEGVVERVRLVDVVVIGRVGFADVAIQRLDQDLDRCLVGIVLDRVRLRRVGERAARDDRAVERRVIDRLGLDGTIERQLLLDVGHVLALFVANRVLVRTRAQGRVVPDGRVVRGLWRWPRHRRRCERHRTFRRRVERVEGCIPRVELREQIVVG